VMAGTGPAMTGGELLSMLSSMVFLPLLRPGRE
jgi:hypothetical protein